jgi:hypothetical protein
MQDSFEPQSSDNESALPAPYNSPWKALGQDLRAVSADLRLRSQELWRRNREGDLSVPAFWPESLASLFWPALLGFILTLLVLGGIQLREILRDQSPPSPPEVERVRTTPFPEARPLPIPTNLQTDLDNEGMVGAPTDTNPSSSTSSSSTNTSGPEALSITEQDPDLSNLELEPPTAEPTSDLLRFDPLLELLAEESSSDSSTGGSASNQGSALIVSAQPQPERNAVTLVIDAEAWRQRSPEQRQQLAEAWWTRLEDQGYADLRLVNDQQDLLARPARIGGGMIVFDPKRV